MKRLLIVLDGTEFSALNTLATQARRDPRAQAAIIVRQQLIQYGLLRAEPNGDNDLISTQRKEIEHDNAT